jgi:hypothetical protein
MENLEKHAVALINECKTRGYYDKPIPTQTSEILDTASFLSDAASKAYETGKKGNDILAILKVAESYLKEKQNENNDPDKNRYNSFVEEELSGLPIPQKIEGGDIEMPFSLENLSGQEILKYMGIYNSCSAYANYLYSLEEAGEASAKLIADEYFDKFLVTVSKKDEETHKPKTNRQLEAEAVSKDENVKKWRNLQKEHSIRANRYKRLRDIYSDNCERLSRAFTIKQDERSKAYNG